jgi:hypothetical protein
MGEEAVDRQTLSIGSEGLSVNLLQEEGEELEHKFHVPHQVTRGQGHNRQFK